MSTVKGLDYEVALLEKLVSIDTDVVKKAGYEEAASLIASEAETLGLKVEVFDAGEKVGDGVKRPNVVATLDVGADRTLIVAAHYDVVPPGEGWSIDPFKPKIEDDKLYGRGAADDKSAVAAILGAARRLGEKSNVNLKLLFTCEEEVGGEYGLGYLINDVGITADEALVVDGSSKFVGVGASGVVTGKIVVKGVQGHAGYPHLAKNPVYALARAVAKLEEFAKKRETKLSVLPSPPGSPKPRIWGRFSVTVLRAGEKSNVIPGVATAAFDLRVLPDEPADEAIQELRDFVKKISAELGEDVELADVRGGGNYYTDPAHPFVVSFKMAVERAAGKEFPIAGELGGNDGRYTAARGIPTIVFGCISPDTRFHGVDEFVYLDDVKLVRDAIVEYCLRPRP